MNPHPLSSSLQIFPNKAVFIKPAIYPSSSVVPCIALYWAKLDHYFVLSNIFYILFYSYNGCHFPMGGPVNKKVFA
jgi:hypothetical protein